MTVQYPHLDRIGIRPALQYQHLLKALIAQPPDAPIKFRFCHLIHPLLRVNNFDSLVFWCSQFSGQPLHFGFLARQAWCLLHQIMFAKPARLYQIPVRPIFLRLAASRASPLCYFVTEMLALQEVSAPQANRQLYACRINHSCHLSTPALTPELSVSPGCTSRCRPS